MTRIKLKFNDIDQHIFTEKGLRGGISVITLRKSDANNKYLIKFDKNKEPKYISFLYVNNLYRWGMIQYLPYRDTN